MPPTALSGSRGLQWLRYIDRLAELRGRGLALVLGLLVLLWLTSGIYKVQPDEQGIELRFGRWTQTTEPGLHYHWPYPVETVQLPQVTQVNQLVLGTARGAGTEDAPERQMLTGDENILEAECVVLWRIKDAGRFLFSARDSTFALKLAAESALREVIARTPIQAALSDRRQQIADETRTLLQTLMDRQRAGIDVVQIQLQRVDPPAAVIDAFNDVQRARADQERARNEAEAYANDILPRARGEAARIGEEAKAYQAQVLSQADSEARSFDALRESHARAPEVTGWRLYLESVDEMLHKAARVIVDGSGHPGGIQPYLALDARERAAAPAASASKEPAK